MQAFIISAAFYLLICLGRGTLNKSSKTGGTSGQREELNGLSPHLKKSTGKNYKTQPFKVLESK